MAAFLVLRPAPPSPAGAVRDYFAHLASGDTAAALALVDSSDAGSAPLLVPEALASSANRPTGVTVAAGQEPTNGSRYTTVSVTYKIGEQSVRQAYAVVATGDEETPYQLDSPFLYLTVEAPDGMAVAVNGIEVDAATVARGTPAFPGAYQATTTGNALFAGSTQGATYQADGRYTRADIDFGQPPTASSAPQAVQAAAEKFLDANCVNPPADAYSNPCPLRAPYKSYGQTTTWAITAYPQVQLSDSGRAQVQFTTGTPGSASYTITYADYSGVQQTVPGTVPIDVRGYAGIGDDGAIRIALGY